MRYNTHSTQMKMKTARSLGTKIVIYITLLVVLVCVALGYFSYRSAEKNLLEAAEESLVTQAVNNAKLVSKAINSDLAILETIAQHDHIKDMVWEEQVKVLQDETARNLWADLGIASPDGMLSYGSGNTDSIHFLDFFKTALNGQSSFSDPESSYTNASVEMWMASPIKDRINNIQGVLVARRSAASMNNIITEIQVGQNGYGFILNDKGTVIAHPTISRVLQQQNDLNEVKNNPALQSFVDAQKKMIAGETDVSTYTLENKEYYIGYAPIEGTSWSLGIVLPRDEALAGVFALSKSLQVLTIGLVFLGILLGVLIGRIIRKPVNQALTYANELAQGNLDYRMDDKRQDEFGLISRALNTASNSLLSIIKHVKRASKQSMKSIQEAGLLFGEINAEIQQVSAATQEISASMEESSAATQEIAATFVTVKDSVDSMTSQAENGLLLAMDIKGRAEKLSNESISAQQNTEQIYTKTKADLQKAIKDSKIVHGISDMANSILEIADQTNLLALNAAIEAARAGEHGRGFAVVANEVKQLAEDSSKAATNIQETIKKVLTSVEQLSQSSQVILDFIENNVTKDYEHLVEVGNQYDLDSQTISQLLQDFASITKEIAAAVEEVSRSSEEIAMSVGEGARASGDIATSINQVSHKAEQIMTTTGSIFENTQDLMDKLSILNTGNEEDETKIEIFEDEINIDMENGDNDLEDQNIEDHADQNEEDQNEVETTFNYEDDGHKSAI